MLIAVSSSAPDLNGQVDPRFGRCEYFMLYDTETRQPKALKNRAASSSGGTGIQAAQLIVDNRVTAVLTGNIGPNAFRVLEAAGVRCYTGCSGPIKQALEEFVAGQLSHAAGANVREHHGRA